MCTWSLRWKFVKAGYAGRAMKIMCACRMKLFEKFSHDVYILDCRSCGEFNLKSICFLNEFKISSTQHLTYDSVASRLFAKFSLHASVTKFWHEHSFRRIFIRQFTTWKLQNNYFRNKKRVSSWLPNVLQQWVVNLQFLLETVLYNLFFSAPQVRVFSTLQSW